MKIKVTGDSTCDLSKELIEKYNVGILSLNVSLGERHGIDGETVFTDDIFEYYNETKKLPQTASRSIEDYVNFFQKYVDEGYTVIHYNLSSAMSSSYDNACKAAETVGNVFTVDSCSLSTGTALLMLDACECAEKGMSAESIVERSNKRKKYVQASFIIENLEFLYKGGRCSALAYYGSNLLSLKPSISVVNGKMGVAHKFVGRYKRCVEKYVESVREEFATPDKTRCFVTHSKTDSEVCKLVKDMVSSWGIFDEVLETDAGSTVTTHCGENTIGVLFINDGGVNN